MKLMYTSLQWAFRASGMNFPESYFEKLMTLQKQIKCLALSQQIKQISVLVHVFLLHLVNFGMIVQLWVILKSKYYPVPQLLNFIILFNLMCV